MRCLILPWKLLHFPNKKKLRTTRPYISTSATKWRGDERANLLPQDTRAMQSNRFVSDDVRARGPGKGPVSRTILSDDEFRRKLISVNPEMLQSRKLWSHIYRGKEIYFMAATQFVWMYYFASWWMQVFVLDFYSNEYMLRNKQRKLYATKSSDQFQISPAVTRNITSYRMKNLAFHSLLW